MGGFSIETATLGLGALLAVTMFVTLAGRAWLQRTTEVAVPELSLYQVALLAGGPRRVCDTALAYLNWAGMIEVRESTDRLVRVAATKTLPDLHPVELSIFGAVDTVGVRPEAAIGSGRQSAREEVDGLTGLVVSPRNRLALGLVVVIGCGLIVIVGVARSGGSSAGFLPLLALTSLVYMAWWFLAGQPRVTGAGNQVLEGIRERYDRDLEIAAIGVTSLPVERAMHVIALYGRDALTGGLSGLRKVMTGNPAPVLVARSSLSR